MAPRQLVSPKRPLLVARLRSFVVSGLGLGFGVLSLVPSGCSFGQAEQDWLGGQPGNSDASSTSTQASSADRTSNAESPTAEQEEPSSSSTEAPSSETSESSSSQDSTSQSDGGSSTESESDSSNESGESLACGVRVVQVSINQSAEIPLTAGAELLPAQGPRAFVWGARRSLVRVYLDSDEPILTPMRVVLETANEEGLWQRDQVMVLLAPSNPLDLSSTATFVVPRDRISEQSKFRVRVYQPGSCTPRPTDLPAVPKEGFFELGATKAPSLQLQFVRARYFDQEEVALLEPEFLRRLRSDLLARYPLVDVTFNPREDLRATVLGSVQGEQDLAQKLLGEIHRIRDEKEDEDSAVHYIGLANYRESVSLAGDAPQDNVAGVGLVNVRGKDDRVRQAIVRLVGRLHGLSEDFCDKGESSQTEGKIGSWGFDGRQDGLVHPNRYEDVSCKLSEIPAWVHPTSYVHFAERAQALQGK